MFLCVFAIQVRGHSEGPQPYAVDSSAYLASALFSFKRQYKKIDFCDSLTWHILKYIANNVIARLG